MKQEAEVSRSCPAAVNLLVILGSQTRLSYNRAPQVFFLFSVSRTDKSRFSAGSSLHIFLLPCFVASLLPTLFWHWIMFKSASAGLYQSCQICLHPRVKTELFFENQVLGLNMLSCRLRACQLFVVCPSFTHYKKLKMISSNFPLSKHQL